MLRFWHLASLDAPTVAVIWVLAFARAAHVPLPVWIPLGLGLMTWAVYVVDRLLDARRGLRTPHLHPLRERHWFHWRYRRVLLPLACGAACTAAFLVLERMTRAAMERNGVLAAVTLAYFTRVHSPAFAFRLRRGKPLLPAELVVGLIFTAACVLPVFGALLAARQAPAFGLWVAVLLFALLSWLNAHAIGCWEGNRTRSRVRVCGYLLGGAGLICAFALPSSEWRMSALMALGCMSALMLGLLDRVRDRLTPLALRACADLVLVTPLALLLR